MADIPLFRPRPCPALAGPVDVRADIEAAQFALDTADRLIALFDGMDGGPDQDPGDDDEPDLGAPEGHDSQVVWLRGTTRDLELDQQAGANLRLRLRLL